MEVRSKRADLEVRRCCGGRDAEATTSSRADVGTEVHCGMRNGGRLGGISVQLDMCRSDVRGRVPSTSSYGCLAPSSHLPIAELLSTSIATTEHFPSQPSPPPSPWVSCGTFTRFPPSRAAANVFRWYKGLTPKSRLMLGGGIMAYAVVGMYLTDKAEEKFNFKPTEQDREELQKVLPKIITVEREKRP
jgi:hypothetical protein